MPPRVNSTSPSPAGPTEKRKSTTTQAKARTRKAVTQPPPTPAACDVGEGTATRRSQRSKAVAVLPTKDGGVTSSHSSGPHNSNDKALEAQSKNPPESHTAPHRPSRATDKPTEAAHSTPAAPPSADNPQAPVTPPKRKRNVQNPEETKKARERTKQRKAELKNELGEQWKRLEQINAESDEDVSPILRFSDISDSESNRNDSAAAGDESDVFLDTPPPPESDEEALENLSEEEAEDDDDDEESAAKIMLEIEKKKAELKALEAKGKTRRSKGKSKPKSGLTLPLASGLIPTLRVESAPKLKKPVVSINEVGGLSDKDIEDEPPTSLGVSPRRMVDRRKVVSLAQPARPSPATKDIQGTSATSIQSSSLPIRSAHTPASSTLGGHARNSRRVTQSEGKATSSSRRSQKNTHPLHGTPTPHPGHKGPTNGDGNMKVVTSGNVLVSDLPAWATVNKTWTKSYLPTLYWVMFCSEDPFKSFAVSTTGLLKHTQQSVDWVYPDSGHIVKPRNDAIYFLSLSRLAERRNAIGRDAEGVVSEYLRSLETPAEASSWLRWARQLRRGPLFFRDPVPLSTTAAAGDSDFVPPGGRMRSTFVLTLLKKHLVDTRGASRAAKISFDRPYGLVGLILAALERAVFALEPNGNRTNQTIVKFSDETFGAKVKTYVTQAQRLNHHQWEDILSHCADGDDDRVLPADYSLADIEREDLFDFQSPQKKR